MKLLAKRDQPICQSRVGIMGFTFKENVPDIRNSKVVDIHKELRAFGIDPVVHDPVAEAGAVNAFYGLELCDLSELHSLSALIFAVAHRDFESLDGEKLSAMIAPGGILVDVRSQIDPATLRQDIHYWSL